MDLELKRAKRRAATARYRAKLKDAGLKVSRSADFNEKCREYAKRKRADAALQGEKIAADTWHSRNPEKHLKRVQRYRSEHLDRQREVTRLGQASRRSTPWGKINNCLWPVMHSALRRASHRSSKYASAMGYSWADLRSHLEARFTPEMTWENWGVVWELDHVRPVSLFKYTSLDDPLFKEAWALSNLRPLTRLENQSKGNRTP